jgi:hypothetical protein
MIVPLVFRLLIDLSGSAGVFFLARGLRKKLMQARRNSLRNAWIQETIFSLSGREGPETSPRKVAVRFPLDAEYQRCVAQTGAYYQRYQAELRHQAKFESQDTIELPATPPGAIRHTEPIRKCRLERDTEGVRSVFPPLRGEEPNQ